MPPISPTLFFRYGCTPTKTLVYRTEVAHYARNDRILGATVLASNGGELVHPYTLILRDFPDTQLKGAV